MGNPELCIGRQPILDRRQQIVGFELLFRSGDCRFADFTDYLKACAEVIDSALSGFGIQSLLGCHKGYINMVTDLLMSENVELLPRGQVVIELLESVPIGDPVILTRCRELKEMGFSLALDDHNYSPEFEKCYDVVDVIKVDVLGRHREELAAEVAHFRRWPLTLVAEKVETEEQFLVCRDLGFDLFQGYYFAHPAVFRQNRLEPGEVTILNLVNQLLSDEDISVIEETFRQNPNLTYNLLRLVNSVGVGTREKIRSLRHAITVLGRDQLLRWLQIAIYASRDSRGDRNPLLEIAAMRGRLMELIVKGGYKEAGPELADSAFMAGILSLVDVLFHVPMAELTSTLNLSEDISQALLCRGGEVGRLLSLVESLEQYDFTTAAVLMGQAGLSGEILLAAEAESINWSSHLGGRS